MATTLAATTATTAFLVILLLFGLLLIYLLLRARLEEFSKTLAAMRADLAAVQREEAPRADQIESQTVDLAPLEARLEELSSAIAALRGQVETVITEQGRERGHRLLESIESRFRSRGYKGVKVLSDTAGVLDELTHIAVEAQKGGITEKGYVVVENGRIVDEKLNSSYEVFP